MMLLLRADVTVTFHSVTRAEAFFYVDYADKMPLHTPLPPYAVIFTPFSLRHDIFHAEPPLYIDAATPLYA